MFDKAVNTSLSPFSSNPEIFFNFFWNIDFLYSSTAYEFFMASHYDVTKFEKILLDIKSFLTHFQPILHLWINQVKGFY